MGFGFVVARFALFLQELQIAQHAPVTRAYGLSLWFGTVLIGASVVVNVLSDPSSGGPATLAFSAR